MNIKSINFNFKEYLKTINVPVTKLYRVSDNCVSENKSHSLLHYQGWRESGIQTIMLFKCAGHSKSRIDGFHNVARRTAERQNRYNLALTVPDLIRCCEEDEENQRLQRKTDFKRFFELIPVPCPIEIPTIPNASYSLNVIRSRMIMIQHSEKQISLR